jgi:CBS domain-containing protein
MALKDNLQNETVMNLPSREAITVTGDTSVLRAIERLREKRLGCAVVVDADSKPIGTFSERGLIDLLVSQPVDLTTLPVRDCLDKVWLNLPSNSPIQQVLDLILDQQARFICVTDEAGHTVALTGQRGLSEYIADHFPQQVMVQRVGGRPGTTTREGA